MEFEKVDNIPPKEHVFKMSAETEKMIGILNGLESGEIVKFPVSELSGKDVAGRESKKIIHRLRTATKHADGYFKVYRRRFDVYVSRRE